jgi:hypothetical protein
MGITILLSIAPHLVQQMEMKMSAAVLEMLEERLAGRPPHLPPPTRREEAPEPVRMRQFAACIEPPCGVAVLETVSASSVVDARTKVRAIGRLLFWPQDFKYTVRRATPRADSAFGELTA